MPESSRALPGAGFAIFAPGWPQSPPSPPLAGADPTLDVAKLEKLFLSLA